MGGVVTEAVNTKVTTRQTYVLTGIEGDLISKDGKLTFIEKDGIDYAPTTVQLPGGERGFALILSDESLIGKRRAAQRVMASTLEKVPPTATNAEVEQALQESLLECATEVGFQPSN